MQPDTVRPFDPVPVLDPNALYWGDNGRCFCGECAGASAKYTGRDLSGQPVERITPEMAQSFALELSFVPKCESCDKEAAQ